MQTIKSYSGDRFLIPKGQESEIKEYREATKFLDEEKMLWFEEGNTGWRCVK